MTNPLYRQATPADRDAIVQFQINMAQETEGLSLNRELCTQGVQAVFDEPSHGQYFVAEMDGKVVAGLLITYEWSDWRNGVVWWIQSVYVLPEARRQGIYKGLYAHVKNLVQSDPSVCGIRLYAEKNNVAAHQVYTRLGMNGEHYQVFEWMK